MREENQFLAGVSEVIAKVDAAILRPLITLLFAAAFAYFLWGVYVFIKSADNPEGRETGRRHILFGIIGIAIMVTVNALIVILLRTFDIPLS